MQALTKCILCTHATHTRMTFTAKFMHTQQRVMDVFMAQVRRHCVFILLSFCFFLLLLLPLLLIFCSV